MIRRLLGLRKPLHRLDPVFTDGTARPARVQAVALDPRHGNSLDALRPGVQRAATRGEFLHLYGHDVGEHGGPWVVTPATLHAVIDLAHAHGLPVVGYEGWLAQPTQTAGIVMSFDDAYTRNWRTHLVRWAERGASATLFVKSPGELNAAQWGDLAALQEAGHDLGCHGALHARAAPFVRRHGLDAWLSKEVDAAIGALAGNGVRPVSFSYPYGSSTATTDRALRSRFRVVRGTAYTL